MCFCLYSCSSFCLHVDVYLIGHRHLAWRTSSETRTRGVSMTILPPFMVLLCTVCGSTVLPKASRLASGFWLLPIPSLYNNCLLFSNHFGVRGFIILRKSAMQVHLLDLAQNDGRVYPFGGSQYVGIVYPFVFLSVFRKSFIILLCDVCSRKGQLLLPRILPIYYTRKAIISRFCSNHSHAGTRFVTSINKGRKVGCVT